MTKKVVTDPLKIEWDEKKGVVTRTCKVCGNKFKAEHWKQSICKEPICKDYSFRYAHVRASVKRWDDIVKQVDALGMKPAFTYTK